MGLKDLVKSGVNSAISKGIDGVAKGIGKGISEAVSDAVEKKVAPTADKLAGEAAEKLNETAASLNQSLDEAKTAADQAAGAMAAAADQASATLADEAAETASMAQAAAGSMAAAAAGTETTATQAPAQGGGFASLAGALSGIMGSLENAATEAASGIKICPSCGEGAPASNKFCPKCGAPLPEKTVGELYVCPKCGKKNLPGTKFCVECGTVLPAAEQEMAEQKAKDDAVLASWSELLPTFPVWNGGGSEFELFENDTQNGYPVYRFEAVGVDMEAVKAYAALLEEQGFVQPEGHTSGETLYKTIDGICRTFNMSNAIEDKRMSIGFYVSDYDKPKPKKEEKSTAESVIDGVVAAKKVLGKLFG